MQRYLKYTVIGLSLVGAVLSLAYNVMKFGVHGVAVLVGCLAPAALAGWFTVKPPMPRWAAVVSAVSLLVVGMKTSGDDKDIQNIMVASFFAMIAAIVLAIKPERPR